LVPIPYGFLKFGARPHQTPQIRIPSRPDPQLDVTPAPLQFVPDHAKERGLGQRGQRQRSFRLANGDDRSAFDVYRLAAVQR